MTGRQDSPRQKMRTEQSPLERNDTSSDAATWFMGSMLTLCLVLVASFLLLIAYHGLAAFWPKPVVSVAQEGQPLLMGELEAVAGTDALLRVGNDRVDTLRWVPNWTSSKSHRHQSVYASCVEIKGGQRIYGYEFPSGEGRLASARAEEEPAERDSELTVVYVPGLSKTQQYAFSSEEDFELSRLAMEDQEFLRKRFPFLKAKPASTDDAWGVHSVGRDAIIVSTDSQPPKAYLISRAFELSSGQGDPELKHSLLVSPLERVEYDAQFLVSKTRVNALGWGGKLRYYLSQWAVFLFTSPPDGENLTGMLPALIGTVLLTLVMLSVVVPLGLTAALYLREYTQGGWAVTLVRASITNLAGVPSVVFGVFGLAFFCYTMGAFIDGGPSNIQLETLPAGLWLGLVLFFGFVNALSFAAFLYFNVGIAEKQFMPRLCLFAWLLSSALTVVLVSRSPLFDGFYAEDLPNPTFGKGGLIWSALTLSLLTLPTMIVTCEEALARVPKGLRTGSTACGATKWQTIRYVILPFARQGIVTGAILCMARGTAAVAPLMLVGVLPYVGDWPIDGQFPFVHASRGFMHLGHQVYVLGFESQDAESARPLAFACCLLLVLTIAVLNLLANWMRSRMRQGFSGL